jgi:hypothetical protein
VTVAVGLLLLVLALCAVLLFRGRPSADHSEVSPPEIKPSYRLLTDLYAIHRRLDVAHVRFALHRDAADARRRLHSELREMDWKRQ